MKEKNLAFIDGQNLYLGTNQDNWNIDYKKFRIFLRDKYGVSEAYYYLGFLDEGEQELYSKLQKAGFIIIFRDYNKNMKGKKKGNVDVDIVFDIMKNIIENRNDFDKMVLVSGDGDYIRLVKYLISKDLLLKILFPSSKYSSLYKKIKFKYGINLSLHDIKEKIKFTK